MRNRIDTDALKRSRPIAEVVASYGIDLRRAGRALVGRCPFHTDSGRPNLHVYPATDSFYCFRCGVGGDAITFVEQSDGVNFLEAVERLGGSVVRIPERAPISLARRRRRHPPSPWGPDEWDCLAAAVELYHNRLRSDSQALSYVEGRGLERQTLERCQVGYAAGDELAAYLRWRRIPTQAALRTGLLHHGGEESMAGRVVVPEIRGARPVWLIGRTLADDGVPKYLGLPGTRRLLGWEDASRERTVHVVEGVFDWLTLRQWDVPAVALLGTHIRPAMVEALRRFEHVYLALDGDAAGREATQRLLDDLGTTAVPVMLPGVKDVAELAARPGGAAYFSRSVAAAQPALAA